MTIIGYSVTVITWVVIHSQLGAIRSNHLRESITHASQFTVVVLFVLAVSSFQSTIVGWLMLEWVGRSLSEFFISSAVYSGPDPAGWVMRLYSTYQPCHRERSSTAPKSAYWLVHAVLMGLFSGQDGAAPTMLQNSEDRFRSLKILYVRKFSLLMLTFFLKITIYSCD